MSASCTTTAGNTKVEVNSHKPELGTDMDVYPLTLEALEVENGRVFSNELFAVFYSSAWGNSCPPLNGTDSEVSGETSMAR